MAENSTKFDPNGADCAFILKGLSDNTFDDYSGFKKNPAFPTWEQKYNKRQISDNFRKTKTKYEQWLKTGTGLSSKVLKRAGLLSERNADRTGGENINPGSDSSPSDNDIDDEQQAFDDDDDLEDLHGGRPPAPRPSKSVKRKASVASKVPDPISIAVETIEELIGGVSLCDDDEMRGGSFIVANFPDPHDPTIPRELAVSYAVLESGTDANEVEVSRPTSTSVKYSTGLTNGVSDARNFLGKTMSRIPGLIAAMQDHIDDQLRQRQQPNNPTMAHQVVLNLPLDREYEKAFYDPVNKTVAHDPVFVTSFASQDRVMQSDFFAVFSFILVSPKNIDGAPARRARDRRSQLQRPPRSPLHARFQDDDDDVSSRAGTDNGYRSSNRPRGSVFRGGGTSKSPARASSKTATTSGQRKSSPASSTANSPQQRRAAVVPTSPAGRRSRENDPSPISQRSRQRLDERGSYMEDSDEVGASFDSMNYFSLSDGD